MSQTLTRPPRSPRPTRPARAWVADILTSYVGLQAGVSFVLAVAFTALPGLGDSEGFATLVDLAWTLLGAQPNLGWATAVFLVTGGLAARKRAAWWFLLTFTVVNLVSDVSFSLDGFSQAWLAVPLQGLVLVALVWCRAEFAARVRAAALPAALVTLVLGSTLSAVLGLGLLTLFPGTVPAQDRWTWALIHTVGLGIGDVESLPGMPPEWVLGTLGLLGSLSLVAATLVLLRSRRTANALTDRDEHAVRGLLDRYGDQDSLAYFATRRDKSVVFSPDGRAAIAYRVEVGVALAAGDPVGDRGSWDQAIQTWLAGARTFGWAPAVIGASTAGATAYHRHGLSALDLGDEAILDVGEFSLRGPDMTPVRQAVTRATRAGVSVRIRRHHDVDPAELGQAAARAQRWRGDDDERGFSMALGRLGDPADGECLLVEALGPADPATPEADPVVGLLSFVPWGPAGASLDLMRRDPAAPNGTFELMVAELCRRGDEFGLRRVSLNFAMFREAFEEGEQLGAGPVLRLWRGVLVFLSRWWQLESLYKANLKYQPAWSPRFLCYADARRLPRVGVAVGVAEGFLWRSRPRWHWRGSLGEVPSNAPLRPLIEDDEPGEPRRPEQVRVRMAKAGRLAEAGVDPWPVAQPPTMTVAGAAAATEGTAATIAGRLLALRDFGGVLFGVVRDWSGDLQVILERDRLGADGPQGLTAFRGAVDLGDLIGVGGQLGRSRSGELSLLVNAWRIEAKCLHPLPDKWRGMTDPESRVRQRYLDMAVNPAIRRRLRARSAVLQSLRNTLHDRGYLEVETPILQTIHGGANARPFRTHINAYDLDLYLRIAPELYLKRCCVGGMDKVFELGRTFRNEGVDFSHNPEFTILEAYEAHGDYLTMMTLCRELIQAAAIAANGSAFVPGPDGSPVDIGGQWPVKTLFGAISEALERLGGHPVDAATPLDDLRAMADLAGVAYQSGWDGGALALELYERLVEHATTMPTFYTDFPVSVSPLTRSHRSVPGLTERWDLVAWGVELGTAYSELTDPLEQRRRLTAQSQEASRGDPEAMELDEDFLTALEYGMPPTGGLGIGVDRVVMLVTGASIRETLPFPMTKPR
ncbi:MAG: bifunctional lysylphosphatidylglycerol synthetase/lysine--tRNA ligase LysX [Austwickia sp.]|nr:bifunctional lysylphosphatidylglycerol synthetase/lysine--tRNA ligase LysX [Austwickia sp.]MBK9102389.1 bifunctional lysylphosphatidylglycerol synthetase/lysine--tRNA ligase LysX [Austwickia sp.]